MLNHYRKNSSGNGAKAPINISIKDLLKRMAKDQVCATMNSGRCNDRPKDPIWPPKLPNKPEISDVCK